VLAPVAIARNKNIGLHDNVVARKDSLHGELDRQLMRIMKIHPASDGVDPMVIVDVSIHHNSICGVYDSVIGEWGRRKIYSSFG
jgi:hypothetical protein